MNEAGMSAEEGWLIPERGEPWFTWGFGTRTSVLRNEPAHVKQVHGAEVWAVSSAGFAGEGDALITGTPGIRLGIKTADCLPILMVDRNRRAVAAVHAGWRGTEKGIGARAVLAMQDNYETNPRDLLIAFGPAIGQCCFEVGPEVARAFSEFDNSLSVATGKCHLDLQAINAWQLGRAGVLPGNILRNELCTVCDAERLWSYRREGEGAGRMWSVVGLKG